MVLVKEREEKQSVDLEGAPAFAFPEEAGELAAGRVPAGRGDREGVVRDREVRGAQERQFEGGDQDLRQDQVARPDEEAERAEGDLDSAEAEPPEHHQAGQGGGHQERSRWGSFYLADQPHPGARRQGLAQAVRAEQSQPRRDREQGPLQADSVRRRVLPLARHHPPRPQTRQHSHRRQ